VIYREAMWTILEASAVEKELQRCPRAILEKYEQWKAIVQSGGPQALRQLRGLRDEALKGRWRDFRSSRLGLQWRVIYQVQASLVSVAVVRISAHDYRP
jgi:addiction module RelE/StbE family toxin